MEIFETDDLRIVGPLPLINGKDNFDKFTRAMNESVVVEKLRESNFGLSISASPTNLQNKSIEIQLWTKAESLYEFDGCVITDTLFMNIHGDNSLWYLKAIVKHCLLLIRLLNDKIVKLLDE